jgi:flagellar biosynthetic protein FliP
MGFMIFVPFLIIDFLVASNRWPWYYDDAAGSIALPFKIMLFVLVDGWTLYYKSLIKSFAV